MEESNKTPELQRQPDELSSAMPSPWLLWWRVWITPLAGWKRMHASKLKPASLASAVYYPLIALAALGAFANLYYRPGEYDVARALTDATCVFVTFFVSYFAFVPCCRLIMRKNCSSRFDNDFGRCYALSLLATLTFFYFLYELMPFLEPVLAFAPAYTLFLSYKGVTTLRIPQEKMMSTWAFAVILIIALPFAIREIFSLFL